MPAPITLAPPQVLRVIKWRSIAECPFCCLVLSCIWFIALLHFVISKQNILLLLFFMILLIRLPFGSLSVFVSSPPYPFLCFWHPLLLLFSFSNLFFPSQADSYPFLPYGLEEFPNGHSDLYHAARKLWVLFSSSSSFCPPHTPTGCFWSVRSLWFSTLFQISNTAAYQEKKKETAL